MKKFGSILLLILSFIIFNAQILPAQELKEKDNIEILGKKLVYNFWNDLKQNNIESINKYMASGFQSIHNDGARSKEEELKLIKNLNLGDFELTNFKVTQADNLLVVTYFASVKETIDKKILKKTKPAARLSAWIKTDKGWLFAIHANLRPLN